MEEATGGMTEEDEGEGKEVVVVVGMQAPLGQAPATALLLQSRVVKEVTAVSWDSGQGVFSMPIVT